MTLPCTETQSTAEQVVRQPTWGTNIALEVDGQQPGYSPHDLVCDVHGARSQRLLLCVADAR